MGPVTPQDLEVILGAADAYVRNMYASFRQCLGNDKYMAEVGLTDLYMMKAASEARARSLTIKFDKSTNENVWGADFEASYFNGDTPTSIRTIYFQAKVLKNGGADFLYESTNHQTYNYQVVLLAQHVADQQARGYYIIYDSTGVQYVNVGKVLPWITAQGDPVPPVPTLNQQLYSALARTTLALADDA